MAVNKHIKTQAKSHPAQKDTIRPFEPMFGCSSFGEAGVKDMSHPSQHPATNPTVATPGMMRPSNAIYGQVQRAWRKKQDALRRKKQRAGERVRDADCWWGLFPDHPWDWHNW